MIWYLCLALLWVSLIGCASLTKFEPKKGLHPGHPGHEVH